MKKHLFKWLLKRAEGVMSRRAPDYIVGGKNNPYLYRWWIIPRNPIFNIYLHYFLRSDDPRALHDHPWFNISLLLNAEYLEHRPGHRFPIVRRRGSIIVRRPTAAHRIQLFKANGKERPVTTLFITGPRVREWGFLCPRGWRRWQDFVAKDDPGAIGPGCD